MNPTLDSLVIGLGWAATGGLVVWLVSYPLQRRSVSWTMASIVITGTVASVAALVGSVHEMLLSSSVAPIAISTSVVAGLVAAAAAAAAARRLSRDNRVLSRAITDLADGRHPGVVRRPSLRQIERLRTELADTATRLAESRDRERALESARRELVAWVSHDLRTPLAGIRAMSEALEDGVVAAPETYYKQIHVEVDRLSTMVEDLFELSRIQSGGQDRRQLEKISLDDLISDCVAALEPLAVAQRVRLAGRAEGIITVTGNGPELNRALTNLIANAIRHTRAEGTVDVRVRVEAEVAEVTVRDGCGGIPPEELPRVFDVGFRGETARTPHLSDPAGAGLGLAITRGIIEAHAGAIEVQNVTGGCAFLIRLPVAA